MDGDRESLYSLTKEELIEEIIRLKAHNKQVRNLLEKQLNPSGQNNDAKLKPKREFDFQKYNTRHILLKILYLGWDYDGLAVQEDTNRTIECALFKALTQTKLIESRSTSNYHRCGRTDKGVSAFCQVISIDLRSNLLSGEGVKVRVGGTAQERKGDTTTELRYIHMLNKVLPHDIRVVAWTPVRADFSARFDCKWRMYKYFFPKGDLNIEKMRKSSEYLLGDHDFRNLCKMDVGNGVVNFVRSILRVQLVRCASYLGSTTTATSATPLLMTATSRITAPTETSTSAIVSTTSTPKFPTTTSTLSAPSSPTTTTTITTTLSLTTMPPPTTSPSTLSITTTVPTTLPPPPSTTTTTLLTTTTSPPPPPTSDNPYDMYELTIVGMAFLWHQIRCIMAILLLVGQGLEEPEITRDLLNVNKHPNKPQYSMASELPLVLYQCDYEAVDWLVDEVNLKETIGVLQSKWSECQIKSTMLRRMLMDLNGISGAGVNSQASMLLPGNQSKVYKPLMSRPTCESLEDRISYHSRKRKLKSAVEGEGQRK